MKMIFIPLAAAIALAACSSGHGNSTSAQARLTDTEAARVAATCMGWPRDVVTQIEMTNRVTPSTEPAPYLNFPYAHSVNVSSSGTCGNIVPTRYISITPMHHLGISSVILNGDPATGHVWIMMIGEYREDGSRFFMGLSGTPATNLPFEPPAGAPTLAPPTGTAPPANAPTV